MSDALENQPPFGGNPGEPVIEVDPHELKIFWQRARDLRAQQRDGHTSIGFELKSISASPENAYAVWYRSSMIWALNMVAKERLTPWIKDQDVSDALFQVIASIPMEWIGHTDREGLPFDLEEFFRRLGQAPMRDA